MGNLAFLERQIFVKPVADATPAFAPCQDFCLYALWDSLARPILSFGRLFHGIGAPPPLLGESAGTGRAQRPESQAKALNGATMMQYAREGLQRREENPFHGV
jgi:hypothetical protein